MHITMYYHYAHRTVCMYFIACYFETVIVNVNFKCGFIWTVTLIFVATVWTLITVNELGIYMQHIWQQTSLLVLCSNIVKEPVPVIVECTKQPFYYTGAMPNCILITFKTI